MSSTPGHRHADRAGALDQEMRGGRERRGLGRAPRRRHRHALAGRAQRDRFEPLPQVLRQRGAGVEDQPQLGEKRARQRLVAFEKRQQRRVAGRHVEIDRGRDLAQVARGLGDQRGHRPAAVDEQRAGVAQHQVEIVVGAEGVVPRQPVEQHQRRLIEKRPDLRELLLVRGQHAVRVDHAFGQAGRSRGEQDLGDGVRADGCGGFVQGRARPALRHVVECGDAVEVGAIAARDQLGLGQVEGGKGFGERAGVGDVDEAGREQFGNVLELGVVLALQGIGDRDRRHGNAGGVAGEREQRMIDAVAGQDHDRPLGRKSALEQALRQCIDDLAAPPDRSACASRRRLRARRGTGRPACARPRRGRGGRGSDGAAPAPRSSGSAGCRRRRARGRFGEPRRRSARSGAGVGIWASCVSGPRLDRRLSIRSRAGPDAIGDFTGPGLKSPASDLMHHNPQWQGRGGPPLGPVAFGSS